MYSHLLKNPTFWSISFADIYLYFLLIQRLLPIMQILYSNQAQRSNPSQPLEYPQDLRIFLSRSSHIHEGNIQLKIKQKMRQQLQLLSSQLYRLSPEKSIDNHQHSKSGKVYQHSSSLRPHHQNASSIQMSRPYSLSFAPLLSEQRYTLNVPVQIIPENQYLQDVDVDDTGQIMDRQFNKLLQINCNNNEDISLDIQSKFVVIKSQKKIKDAELYYPDKLFFNSYQNILKEQNYYLREQLIQFTKDIEHFKIKNNELKLKYKAIKKDNVRLVKQTQDLHEIAKYYDNQLNKKNQQCMNLANQHQQDLKMLDNFNEQRFLLQKRLQQSQHECQMYSVKLEDQQLNRQKQLQSLMQQNGKIKDVYQEQITEKQKQIAQLNDFIVQLKSKISLLQKQAIIFSADEHSHQSRLQQQSKLFEDGANSICLSLAQAQSLKNIIEEKQQMHKAQVVLLNQRHQDEMQKIKKQLQIAQQRIIQVEKNNILLSQQISNHQRKLHSNPSLFHTLPDSTQSLYHDDEWKGLDKQDLIKINSNRRIKKLERQLAQEHEQKMLLLGKITQLQEHGCKQRQEDEQLEQLLQKCVNELQRERQLNHRLKDQMEYLRKLLCKQQGLSKDEPQIYK